MRQRGFFREMNKWKKKFKIIKHLRNWTPASLPFLLLIACVSLRKHSKYDLSVVSISTPLTKMTIGVLGTYTRSFCMWSKVMRLFFCLSFNNYLAASEGNFYTRYNSKNCYVLETNNKAPIFQTLSFVVSYFSFLLKFMCRL